MKESVKEGRSINVILKVYTGEFYNDFYQGFGSIDFGPNNYHGKGWFGEGYFFRDLPHGWIKFTNTVRRLGYEGYYYESLMTGEIIAIFANGDRLIGKCEKSLILGTFHLFKTNGEIMK